MDGIRAEEHTGILNCYTGLFFHASRASGESSDTDREKEDRPLYEVRIIDNDYNTYQEVMEISITALGIGPDEAYAVAWTVDHAGSCVVAVGPHHEAEAIAEVIRTIGIEVRVDPVETVWH
ncbi:MAG: ATP-dependent Clp protease adaptor ClpS [Pseudomonadota bacterium]